MKPLERINTILLILTIILLILTIIFGIFAVRSWIKKEEFKENLKLQIEMYSDNVSTLQRKLNDKGEELVRQKQLTMTERQAKEEALIENEELKNINSEIKVITKTQLKKILIPYTDTVYIDSNSIAKIFRIEDKWYGVDGRVLNKGVLIDSLFTRDSLTITVGEEKIGLFKTKPVVDLISKNPHSRIEGAYNVIIKPRPKKWYETRLASVIGGVLIGVVISR